MADGPDEPTPPARPRVPASLRPDVSADELDPEYPDLDGIDLAGQALTLPEARTLSILRSRLVDCRLDLDPSVAIQVQDSVLVGTDLTGRRIDSLHRVRLERCRLSGADLGEARVRDVTLHDCALDLSSWFGAEVDRLVITGGRVQGLDLSGARLHDVRVADVALDEVVLDRVRAERVDLTDADVAPIASVAALRGCTISPAQAVALAARSARALGIHVRSEG